MAGGLLNIVSTGNNNVFLTGNPTKTFFKVTYSKHTNFGLQKFRIDYAGSRDIQLTVPSQFKFKIPRHAELLMDTYISIQIPDIWSPIYLPNENNNNKHSAYEFKWIRHLGSTMIREISIECGSTVLQRYSGQYIQAAVERDFSLEKKQLFYAMTGHDPSLHDPADANANNGNYPNSGYESNTDGAQPSILGRQLLIPINSWFTLNPGCAFPLINLQYNELYINVTLRPIQELFQVRDVFDAANNFPYIAPDFNKQEFQMYRFLQTPPAMNIDPVNYANKVSVWNPDVHLICTYCFLAAEETKQFALNDQVFLIKDIQEYNFENVVGTSKVSLPSTGMVSSWTWFLQRDDSYQRNEWTNYSNLPYHGLNYDLVSANNYMYQTNSKLSGINTTGVYKEWFRKEIMQTMGILLNGEYRENVLPSGVFNYIEKYTRSASFAEEGIYFYNFGLNTNDYQPSGAINLNKFKDIQLEITTITPTSRNKQFNVICNNGVPVGTTSGELKVYDYSYRMTLYEERYNIVSFISGNVGLLYAK